MIGELKPYPEYKDSGVEWLGEVPAHWEVRRLRNVVDMRVSNVDKHSKDGEQPVRLCNYVDVYKHERIRADMPFMRATATADEIERFRLEEHDVLITKDSEAWDDIGVPALVESSAPDLISGYHLALLRAKQEIIQGAYLLRAMQSRPVSYQLHVEAKGVTRYGLSHHAIKSCLVSVPPLPEQTAIVRFLDYVDRRVRRVIRARQRLVELLEEYKQALIHQAVTGRIDVRTGQPYPAYKDSGVEWLGEVPAHWEVVRLRYLAECLDGKRVPLNSVERGAMQGNIPYWGANCVIDHINRWLFDEPLVLLGEDGAPFFDPFRPVAFFVTGKIWVNNHAHVLRCRSIVVPPFLAAALNRVDYTSYIEGATRDKLTQQDMGSIALPLPPLPEQTAIVEYLDAQTEKLDRAADAARREIELLNEFRTRLIADVVTGKLDVREVAARLPEEPEEPEPLDELEIDAETEEPADDLDDTPVVTEA